MFKFLSFEIFDNKVFKPLRLIIVLMMLSIFGLLIYNSTGAEEPETVTVVSVENINHHTWKKSGRPVTVFERQYVTADVTVMFADQSKQIFSIERNSETELPEPNDTLQFVTLKTGVITEYNGSFNFKTICLFITPIILIFKFIKTNKRKSKTDHIRTNYSKIDYEDQYFNY